GDTGIVMAFSGGGARSAAFGYGALQALAAQASDTGRGRSLADDVVVVSGVSGGAILASYFALNGPAGLDHFQRR
ncbi:patatin-like phospholipase family protein, partial [Streptococcus pneumoniae]|uniref:patatin-like phospholipase family protein n=1 Tax=Streptococcus pneumoniae TaxID=1313 RepID=UPI0019536438